MQIVEEEPLEIDYGPEPSFRALGIWLLLVAILVFIMVLVGGITRLSEAGLAITEWKPVSGIVPPLNETDWQRAFIAYQQIPEYRIVNADMTLDEFKSIYWWEFSHRFLGRFIGVVFLIPFLYFLIRRRVPADLKAPLWCLFLLGALQGALGWFMVQSGLVDRLDVSHYHLALHLCMGFLIYAYALWLSFGLLLPQAGAMAGFLETRMKKRAYLLAVLLIMQLVFGAFVAGLDAGKIYNTWPLMGERFFPEGLMGMTPWYLNTLENHTSVQFIHRMLAYVLVGFALLHYLLARSSLRPGTGRDSATLFLLVLSCQALVGIWTLLNGVPLMLGLAHQLGALLVISALVWHFHCLTKRALTERVRRGDIGRITMGMDERIV